MDGKKTFTGIFAALAGLIGKEFVSADELETIVLTTLQIGGLLYAIYGRVKARKIYGVNNGRGEE